MQNVQGLSGGELQKQYDAYYDFVGIFGTELFTAKALVYFNELKAEYVKRSDTAKIEAAFLSLEQVEESYRKHFGPIPPVTER